LLRFPQVRNDVPFRVLERVLNLFLMLFQGFFDLEDGGFDPIFELFPDVPVRFQIGFGFRMSKCARKPSS
jgi:hypothetical protein